MADRRYSAADKLLHRLALSAPAVGEAAFQFERLLHRSKLGGDSGRHVFVAGLARAGTTLLMRLLHGTGEFASVTYRDMPFVMAPNLWSALSAISRKNAHQRQRAHGDGLLVDYDSPEALEEVFWRVFCGGDYIEADALMPMLADEQVRADFRAWVQLILLRYGRDRYLSKNNNNVLRLQSLHETFPEALVLVPFRRPVDQSASLVRQHQRFCRMQEEDPFVLQYMNWLAHFEFGKGCKPMVFGDRRPVHKPENFNYWLELWVTVYQHLLERMESGDEYLVPVCFEALCDRPQQTWRSLAARVDVAPSLPRVLEIAAPPVETLTGLDDSLLAKAETVYSRLGSRAAEFCDPAKT